MRRLFLGLATALILSFLVTTLRPAPVAAGDGIPDNCEYTGAAYYQANIFPRYKPQDQQLYLADWATGADVKVIAGELGDTRILGWSLDCRYLVGAVGPQTSMDTVVWDTNTATEIGRVLDAHNQPHHITWGPGDYLVVETRDGAILWNVPANTQVTLTTSFNPTSVRNFDRVRWDIKNNQLIANLSVGGRAVYDLTTGQEVAEAVNTNDSVPGTPATTVLLGGKNYDCHGDYGYHYWYNPQGQPNIYLHYSVTDQSIAVVLRDNYRSDETIQMLEANINLGTFETRGWSADCRYVAASLGAPGTDVTSTVVWDVAMGKRVGEFGDAHKIMHPIHWSYSDSSLIIETRDGAYLWVLPTDTRTLINPKVETSLAGEVGIRSFYSLEWDTAHHQLLAVAVGSANGVTAYDAQSGQQVGFYPSGGEHTPVGFKLSPDGSRILVWNADDSLFSVWNRNDGSGITLDLGSHKWGYYSSGGFFSPDSRYLVAILRDMLVWDLQNPNPDGSPTVVYQDKYFGSSQFVDNVTIQAYGGRQLNIVTGADSQAGQPDSPQATTAVAGETGESGWGKNCKGIALQYDAKQGQLQFVDAVSGAVLHSAASSRVFSWYYNWSPDCRYVYTVESTIGDPALPYDDAPLDDTYYDQRSFNLVFWDAQTGQRLGAISKPYRFETGWRVDWSPSSERALVTTPEGSFIYQPATNQKVLLIYPTKSGSAFNTAFSVYWDYARGQVYISSWWGVDGFDMQTGEGRYFFTASPGGGGCGYYGCWFDVSADNRTLYVGGDGVLGVWNLDTLEHSEIYIANGRTVGCCTISPDGRYLVLAYSTIRVWDLHNLPDNYYARKPTYVWRVAGDDIRDVRFIDNTTIEVTTSLGIQQRDVVTGAVLSDIPRTP
ncbi:MAG: WD40 repeat domain-containing protein [Chloroflexota bacterium]